MKIIFACFFLLLNLLITSSANELKNHSSPYLAMHGNDPVNWHEWGPEVLKKARKENKLLFVSVGYFSCHWCHVMHRESYSNKEVAKLINKHFIAVKVDRELRPALDTQLINFVQQTTGNAGWPLNVFITPAGDPLAGFTYLPKERFITYLNGLNERWNKDSASLLEIATSAAELIKQKENIKTTALTADKAADYVVELIKQGLSYADWEQGGFGDNMKFPMVPQMNALLALNQRVTGGELRQFVELTLTNMSSKGMRDQIAGGFFRYSTDPGWKIPHYEKMLYDNALLSTLYMNAADAFQMPAWKAVAFSTLDFMLNELRSEQGAFYASLSAVDNNGVEGGYYLWSEKQLNQLLTADERTAVAMLWDMQGETKQGYLPVQSADIKKVSRDSGIKVERLLEDVKQARQKLLKARSSRTVPVDTKQLAAWNGLALSALSQAGAMEQGDRFRDAAFLLRDYLTQKLWKENVLYRAIDAHHRPLGNASLRDYAYVARGLLDFAQYLDQPGELQHAKEMIFQAWQRFHSDQGWSLDEDISIPATVAKAIITDSTLPSASAVLLESSIRLAEVMDLPELKKMALKALHVDTVELQDSAFYYATHLLLLDKYLPLDMDVRAENAPTPVAK